MKSIAALGIGAIVAVSAVVFAGKGPAPVVEIGKTAPAFTLTDTNGKARNLSDFSGKYVVLEWTNHQCPFVVKHYSSGNMQKTQKWAKDKGVVWLSIVSSAEGKQGYLTPDEANKLMKEKGFNSAAMLMDSDGKVGKLYGARTTPHMYVIDPKGTLIYMGGIDDKATPNVADLKEAKNYVIQALEESMAGKDVSVPTSRPYGCSVKYAD